MNLAGAPDFFGVAICAIINPWICNPDFETSRADFSRYAIKKRRIALIYTITFFDKIFGCVVLFYILCISKYF
jgi:hypothetical protein